MSSDNINNEIKQFLATEAAVVLPDIHKLREKLSKAERQLIKHELAEQKQECVVKHNISKLKDLKIVRNIARDEVKSLRKQVQSMEDREEEQMNLC